MINSIHIGMTESQLERRERLLSAYSKRKRPVRESVRISNENEYSTVEDYHYTHQRFGGNW